MEWKGNEKFFWSKMKHKLNLVIYLLKGLKREKMYLVHIV